MRGIDHADVAERKLAKSVGCSKSFRGPAALRDAGAVLMWLKELGERGGEGGREAICV